MARKSDNKPKMKTGKGKGATPLAPPAAEVNGVLEARDPGPAMPGFYSSIIQSLFEKTRKRVATYYCTNMACRRTFWDAAEGYACPSCGTLGTISQFKYSSITGNSKDRNIVGYLDTVGRLICSNCILNYGVQTEIGLIVYDDTEPFCHELCEMCKEPLGLMQS
jgi:hypothetical protein